jgi:serine/threonine-protein kinase
MLLRKSPATRPSGQRIKSILTSFLQENSNKPEGKAWGHLEKVGAEVAEQEGQAEAIREREVSKRQRRNSLCSAAIQILELISAELLRRIMDSAPLAKGNKRDIIVLGGAVLEISPMTINPIGESAFSQSGWDVVAGAVVKVRQSAPPYEWSASLWYSKEHERDAYRWREVSYFTNAFSRHQPRYEPYFLDDINAADLAASRVMSGYQIAWGPSPIDDEDVEAFYERWADLFARAVRGQLQHPSHLPLR